ncbi:hypothetical protein IWQ60_008034 [Tieghemiomyces parasiticus]|uniref:Uncharacterized protein n=1 Tax=Tieghemiomyces parasiticus TaxID=78921 RepID=A0A9W7ZUY4_9FUNG|nr:hypothetical protein IWQ60_008034 [Tieghemiomyces parasiticus]
MTEFLKALLDYYAHPSRASGLTAVLGTLVGIQKLVDESTGLTDGTAPISTPTGLLVAELGVAAKLGQAELLEDTTLAQTLTRLYQLERKRRAFLDYHARFLADQGPPVPYEDLTRLYEFTVCALKRAAFFQHVGPNCFDPLLLMSTINRLFPMATVPPANPGDQATGPAATAPSDQLPLGGPPLSPDFRLHHIPSPRPGLQALMLSVDRIVESNESIDTYGEVILPVSAQEDVNRLFNHARHQIPWLTVVHHLKNYIRQTRRQIRALNEVLAARPPEDDQNPLWLPHGINPCKPVVKRPNMEDKVVAEIDVFRTDKLGQHLHVFQFPLKETHRVETDLEYPKTARLKPKNFVVELNYSLDTRSVLYNRQKGEDLGLGFNNRQVRTVYDAEQDGVDGGPSLMDTRTLVSNSIPNNTRYMVGILRNNELHLTDVARLVQMYPSLKYLDVIDSKVKSAAKKVNDESQAEISGPAPQPQARAINMQVRNPGAEELAHLRKTSVTYLKQQIEEEPWQPLDYFPSTSGQSELIYSYLLARSRKSLLSEDTNSTFLEKLAKETLPDEVVVPS